MDLRERRQLDMAARMTKVRAKARPWRSIFALILAIAGWIAAQFWGVPGYTHFDLTHSRVHSLIWLTGLAALFVFGMIAAIGLAGRARSGLQPLLGQAHAGVFSYVLVLVGVFAILTITLATLGVSPDKLVLGGAVTGVLIGIAAQQSLANLFAGLVLLFASPFRVGDHVRFRAGALSGEIEGTVTNQSLIYVQLETAEGRVLLPPEPHGATSEGAAQHAAGYTSEATAGAPPAPTGESAA